ncbi:hypothetical protein GQ42DRAFT_85875 [Ramicandelaber brevisporus]|nr:hypothetical protein GQ42DRAFT_85875 [Ramicandelaber brevisporus]
MWGLVADMARIWDRSRYEADTKQTLALAQMQGWPRDMVARARSKAGETSARDKASAVACGASGLGGFLRRDTAVHARGECAHMLALALERWRRCRCRNEWPAKRRDLSEAERARETNHAVGFNRAPPPLGASPAIPSLVARRTVLAADRGVASDRDQRCTLCTGLRQARMMGNAVDCGCGDVKCVNCGCELCVWIVGLLRVISGNEG